MKARTRPPWKSIRLLMRNYFWEKGMHEFEQAIGSVAQPAKIAAQDVFDVHWRMLSGGLDLPQVSPVEQIVDFDKEDMAHRFTFSMWAFREEEFPEILTEYFKLCKGHETAIRTGLPHVSYHISQDARSLLSYSHDGAVWTFDPVCREEGAKTDGWRCS